jgi:hypothetical protein
MRNGEGYPDPTASSAIRNTFQPEIGGIYTQQNGAYIVPVKVFDYVTIGYVLQTSTPYSSEYVVPVDNYLVDVRKVVNIGTNRYEDKIGSITPDELQMLSQKMAEVCGGEYKIVTDDGRKELDAMTEKAQKYQSLYEGKVAELEIANEEIERLRSEPEMKKKQPVALEVFEPHECVVNPIPVDLIKANAERDVYKRLYEELLERMLRKEA